MTEPLHIWLEDAVESDGQITSAVTIEGLQQGRKRLWYRLPVEYKSALAKTPDPFVVGSVFLAMRTSADLVVHGEVWPSLLRNLEEFQAAWSCWLPNKYARVAINVDVEREHPRADNGQRALAAFSGGVDSCFTTYRHTTGNCGRLKRDLRGGVMIHGFDIPLNENEVFERAAAKAKMMLQSIGIELIPMATNFRELEDDWHDAHICGLASCLMMFQEEYGVGLIAGSPPYDNISVSPPWGSNPVTDWMLSSGRFRIIHDGAGFTRAQKLGAMAKWPEAMKYLRVCWEGEQKDRNCCRCEKCIRTILNFRAIGLGLPECFECDITDAQIMSVTGLNSQHLFDYGKILSMAKAASISESWVAALEKCIRRNRRMIAPSDNPLRKIARKVGMRRHLFRLVETVRPKPAFQKVLLRSESGK